MIISIKITYSKWITIFLIFLWCLITQSKSQRSKWWPTSTWSPKSPVCRVSSLSSRSSPWRTLRTSTQISRWRRRSSLKTRWQTPHSASWTSCAYSSSLRTRSSDWWGISSTMWNVVNGSPECVRRSTRSGMSLQCSRKSWISRSSCSVKLNFIFNFKT